MYVFGDSLVDTGNDLILTTALGEMPALPPSRRPNRTYFQGRFSNGPIAFEYLWALLNGQRVPSANGVVPSLEAPKVPRRGAVSFGFGASKTGYLTPIAGSPIPLPGLRGQVELLNLALGGQRAPDRALRHFHRRQRLRRRSWGTAGESRGRGGEHHAGNRPAVCDWGA